MPTPVRYACREADSSDTSWTGNYPCTGSGALGIGAGYNGISESLGTGPFSGDELLFRSDDRNVVLNEGSVDENRVHMIGTSDVDARALYAEGGQPWVLVRIRVPSGSQYTHKDDPNQTFEIHGVNGSGVAPLLLTMWRDSANNRPDFHFNLTGNNTVNGAYNSMWTFGRWGPLSPPASNQFRASWKKADGTDYGNADTYGGGAPIFSYDKDEYFVFAPLLKSDGTGSIDVWWLDYTTDPSTGTWTHVISKSGIYTAYPGGSSPFISSYYPASNQNYVCGNNPIGVNADAWNSGGIGCIAASSTEIDTYISANSTLPTLSGSPGGGGTGGGGGSGVSTPTIEGTVGSTTSGGSAPSLNFTVGSGVNRALLVFVQVRGGDSLSGVTYNGVALTKLGTVTSGLVVTATAWLLLAPPAGAHALVVSDPASNYKTIQAYSLANVDQNSPHGTLATGTGHSPSPTVVVVTGANDLVVGAIAAQDDLATTTITSPGSTEDVNIERSNGSNNGLRGESQHGIAATSIGASLNGTYYWAVAGLAMQGAAVAGDTGSGTVTFSGSGVESTVYADSGSGTLSFDGDGSESRVVLPIGSLPRRTHQRIAQTICPNLGR